ncbi:MAG: hypothetical protein OEY14_06955, partial [Myxococcales bacterium]|nr:hypothetical protein [Myxococcales bacterium]
MLRLTNSGAKLIAASLAACGAALMLSLPRPVGPRELPTLRLDRRAVRASLARDEALALAAPRSSAADRIRALIRAWGEAEASFDAAPSSARERRGLLRALQEAEGGRALPRLRAEALQGLEGALAAAPGSPESRELLGAFPQALERYGAMRGEERLAPAFVIRSLYAARWNAILDLELLDGFDRVQEQAYHGWLGLHASGAAPARRGEALAAFAALGGEDGIEALA